jgi:hypothetical protein
MVSCTRSNSFAWKGLLGFPLSGYEIYGLRQSVFLRGHLASDHNDGLVKYEKCLADAAETASRPPSATGLGVP